MSTETIKRRLSQAVTGLMHLIKQRKERIAELKRNLTENEFNITSVLREFHKLADIHDVWYQTLPGIEVSTFRIDGQLDKANQYRFAEICASVLAVVFGVYFSFQTLNSSSPLLLFLGCTIVAVIFGVIAAAVMRASLGAHPENPSAIKRVNLMIAGLGLGLLILVTAFAWVRFRTNSPLMRFLPGIIVGLELTSVLLAGAFDCGYRMYRWSAVYDQKHRGLIKHREALEDKLAVESVTLQELEYRLDRLQSEETVQPQPHHQTEHDHETANA